MGKSSVNGSLSIAMLNNQRVYKMIPNSWKKWDGLGWCSG